MNVGFPDHICVLRVLCGTQAGLWPLHTLLLFYHQLQSVGIQTTLHIFWWWITWISNVCLYVLFLEEISNVYCIGKEDKIFGGKVDDSPFLFLYNMLMGFRLFFPQTLCHILEHFYIRTVFLFWNSKKGGSMIWINSVISTCVIFSFCNSCADFESIFCLIFIVIPKVACFCGFLVSLTYSVQSSYGDIEYDKD